MPELREMLEAALGRADAASPPPWVLTVESDKPGQDNANAVWTMASRSEHPALVKFALAVMDSKNAVYLTEIQRAIAELAAALDAEK